MIETTKISATCACGALRLDIKGRPVVQLVCHCTDCRAFSGQPYTEAAFFQAAHCQIHGQTEAMTLNGGSGFPKIHHSCARCKTPLFVTVGALNGACAVPAYRLSPFQFKPQAHIWTREKLDTVSLPTDAPHSPDLPPKPLLDIMLGQFWSKGNE
ncbi:GFA family protein [Simiduia litorea]|uniref:GFA family protein n=1 Tax=Simiduia litorea TaxID=1435348 RepID=UPI0036F35418